MNEHDQLKQKIDNAIAIGLLTEEDLKLLCRTVDLLAKDDNFDYYLTEVLEENED